MQHLLQYLLERNGVADGCGPAGKIKFQSAFQFICPGAFQIEKEAVPENIAFRDPAVSLVAETEKNERTFQGDFAVFVRPSDLGPGHQADAQPNPFQVPAGMQSLPAGNETDCQLIEIVIFSDRFCHKKILHDKVIILVFRKNASGNMVFFDFQVLPDP